MQPASRKMGPTNWAACIILTILFIRCADAVYYSSLDAAVNGLPELSVLAGQLDQMAPTLAAQLRAEGFVGTLFAPTNAILSPLMKYQNLMSESLMADVLGMAVIPGPPLKLTDLVNGAVLTTLNGKTVTVTVKQASDGSGPIYYINQARITAGNIYAGGSIIHETFGLIVPSESQKLVSLVSPKDVSSPSASANLSPEGPPMPSPSPSPVVAVPSPSPSPVTVPSPIPSPSPAVVASPSPSPAVTTPTSPSPSPASPSPSPATPVVTSPSPSPSSGGTGTATTSPAPVVTASPSPAPLTAASPSPAPVISSPSPSPSPSPAAGQTSPTPSPAAGQSPSPAPVTSPSPAAPVASPSPPTSGSFWDILNDWAGSDTVGSDPVGSDTTGSDTTGSDPYGSDTVGNGAAGSGSSSSGVVSSPQLLPATGDAISDADLIVDSNQMVGSGSANSTSTPVVIVREYSAGSNAVAGVVGLILPVVLSLLLL